MITITSNGDFKNANKYFERLKEVAKLSKLDSYGKRGVAALSMATPKDTGKTASSWEYKIVRNDRSVSLEFYNTNVVDGVPIAIILQYGHATKSGRYIQGKDYINPAIRPIFDEMLRDIWAEASISNVNYN